jgi:hypothetical protein
VSKEFVSLQGFTPNITAKREMLIVLRLYLNRRRRQAPGGLLRRSQMQAIGDDFLSDAADRANNKANSGAGGGKWTERLPVRFDWWAAA